MKKTIEDIKETKTHYKNHRDAFGNRTREPYEAQVKRPVNVVTGWTRFGHYIIDALIIGVIYGGFLLVVPSIQYLGTISFFRLNDFEYSVSFVNYLVIVAYYFTCEMTMQRTIGKFATNSVVINEYAEKPNSDNLLGRSFARLVPFEALSCFSDRGWHDRWSKTYVVKTSERDQLKRLLNQDQGVFISDSEDLLD